MWSFCEHLEQMVRLLLPEEIQIYSNVDGGYNVRTYVQREVSLIKDSLLSSKLSEITEFFHRQLYILILHLN